MLVSPSSVEAKAASSDLSGLMGAVSNVAVAILGDSSIPNNVATQIASAPVMSSSTSSIFSAGSSIVQPLRLDTNIGNVMDAATSLVGMILATASDASNLGILSFPGAAPTIVNSLFSTTTTMLPTSGPPQAINTLQTTSLPQAPNLPPSPEANNSPPTPPTPQAISSSQTFSPPQVTGLPQLASSSQTTTSPLAASAQNAPCTTCNIPTLSSAMGYSISNLGTFINSPSAAVFIVPSCPPMNTTTTTTTFTLAPSCPAPIIQTSTITNTWYSTQYAQTATLFSFMDVLTVTSTETIRYDCVQVSWALY